MDAERVRRAGGLLGGVDRRAAAPRRAAVPLGDASTGDDRATVHLSWVDTTKPSATFYPPAKVGPSNYTVAASASDNSGAIASYTWWVDDVQQGATGSSLSLSAIGSGVAHRQGARPRCRVGNASAVVAKTVAIDRSVTVTPGTLPAITRAATAPLSFTTDADVVTRKCSVNNGTAVTCTSGWSGISAASADGSYAYRVIVTDDVGNTKTSDARTVIVDRTLPAVAFTDGPTEGQQVVTRNVAITFTHADAHPGTVECRLDGVVKPCTAGSAVSLAGLADGQHAFAVKAVDAAGNERTVTRTFAVHVPVTEPDPGNEPDPDTGGTPTGGGTTTTGGGTTTTGGGGTPSDPGRRRRPRGRSSTRSSPAPTATTRRRPGSPCSGSAACRPTPRSS